MDAWLLGLGQWCLPLARRLLGTSRRLLRRRELWIRLWRCWIRGRLLARRIILLQPLGRECWWRARNQRIQPYRRLSQQQSRGVQRPGGIRARATAHELSAEHEHHFEATSLQRDHEHAAFGNRDMHASFNHGRPAWRRPRDRGSFREEELLLHAEVGRAVERCTTLPWRRPGWAGT